MTTPEEGLKQETGKKHPEYEFSFFRKEERCMEQMGEQTLGKNPKSNQPINQPSN